MTIGVITKLAKIADKLLKLPTTAGSSTIGHDGPESTVQGALDTRASGVDGKLYNLFGGAFRKDLSIAPVWKGIFDQAHVPSLFTEPDESSVDLRLNHATGDNLDICSMLVQADETFAKAGVSFGPSVNKDFCLVSGGAPVDFTVVLTDPTASVIPVLKDNRIFGDARFFATISATGLITIQHPQVQLKRNPEIQHISDTSLDGLLIPHNVKLAAPGQTTLFLLAHLSGRIRYTGSNWVSEFSPYNPSITFSSYDATTGELTVTHPQLTGNNTPQLTDYASTSVPDSYKATIVGNSDTNFIVRFRKLLDDSIPTTIPAGVGFTFDRGHTAILPKAYIKGSIGVFLDVVQVDLRDVNWPNANIWAMGMMGKKKKP